MDKDPKSSGLTGLPGNGVIAVVTLAIGALFLRQAPPLEPTRPAADEPRLELRAAPQDVDARLWQDPLGAVERARKARVGQQTPEQIIEDDQAHRPASLMSGRDRLADGQKTVVLAVMLNGAPYAEQVETRRRMRYAVLSALNAGRFSPVDTEHLGYVLPTFGRTAASDLPKVVPYEWFEPAPGDSALQWPSPRDRRHVLVMWLDARAFRQQPLHQLRGLVDALTPRGAETPPSNRTTWRVLGPADSDGLKAMVEEARHLDDERMFNDVELHLYSPSATVPDDVLMADGVTDPPSALGVASPASIRLADFFGQRGLRLVRSIDDDRKLAMAMIEELERRGLAPASANDAGKDDYASLCWNEHRDITLPSTIAVVAEWDTLYGRNLRRQFMAPSSGGKGFCVEGFSYVRGLDGQLPESAAAPASASDKADHLSPSTVGAGGSVERAEGQAQLDYLRRVAAQVRLRDRQLRANGGAKAGIRAIGVLGNDVHDKLLILQALRSEFPDTIFFTTDLDARFLQPREQAWARNLLVASTFGLRLNNGAQRETPPFRNGYQTAVYFAARLALDANQDEASQTQVDGWIGWPRIFEIGRTGAFDFGASAPAASAQPGAASGVTPSPGLDARRSATRSRHVDWLPLDGARAAIPDAKVAEAGPGRPCWGRDWLRHCADIHPPRSPMYPTAPWLTRFAVISLALLLTWGSVLAISPGARRVWKWIVTQQGAPPSGRRWLALVATFLALQSLLASLLAESWTAAAEWLTSGGKPLSFTEGISLWPTEAMRLLALLLCVYLIARGWTGLAQGLKEISDDFRMPRKPPPVPRNDWQRSCRKLRRLLYGDVDLNASTTLPGMRRTTIRFWEQYLDHNRFWSRAARTACCTVLMLALTALLILACDDQTPVPYRGDLSLTVHHWLARLMVPAIYALIFFVVDATVFCVAFVHRLNQQRDSWPELTRNAVAPDLKAAPPLQDRWIDLQFISRRTCSVSQLVYYPFIVFSLYLLSRNPAFDDWSLSTGTKACMAICVLIVLGCAWALRRIAEKSRALALDEIDALLLTAENPAAKPVVPAAQLRLLRERIVNLHEGAFAPYSQQPMLRAILLPFAALGSSSLLDYMALLSL